MISRAVLAFCLFLVNTQECVAGKSIDEIIMEAAPDVTMFDLVHDMDDGQIMVMVELDILLNITEFVEYTERSNRTKRKAVANEKLLWKNRIVPYEFSNDFSRRDIGTIMEAIGEWENYTCLDFRQATNEHDKIRFRNGGGCYSRLGRTGGIQPIALAPGCRTKGVIVHEIGHAIGWIHEQARPDRDDYIRVNFNQIPPNWRSQFAKVAPKLINARGVEYDYDSIMHYSGNVFGPKTIVTLDPSAQNRIGQRRALSFRDIKLANLMYQCAQNNKCDARQCPGEGFQGKDCKCYCPGKPVTLCEEHETTATPTTSPSTSRPPTQKPTTLPPRHCMDLRKDCASLKASNSCTTDAARMSVFCRRTCDMCNIDPSVGCMDYDEACPFFASNGYCDAGRRGAVSEYFRQECPLSCGVCKPPDPCAEFRNPNSSSAKQTSWLLFFILLMFSLLTI